MRRLPYDIVAINKVIMIMLLCVIYQLAHAQTKPYLVVAYADSLLADDHSFFVYNHITITNTFSQSLSFNCAFEMPNEWKLLSNNNLNIELKPGESSHLNITLNRSKSALAKWEQATIKILIKNSNHTIDYPFYVKANTIRNFKAVPTISEVMVTDTTRYVSLPIRLMNSGNVDDVFYLYYNNYNLELNDKVSIPLPVGQSINYNYKLKLPDRIKGNFIKETVFVNILQKNGRSALYSYILLRSASYRKINPSAFKTFPIVFEGGMMKTENLFSGSHGVHGLDTFKNGDNIIFNYRSKQIGIRGLQRDYFDLVYLHKGWSFNIGQMNEFGLLYNNGNGVKVTHLINENTGYGIYVIKSNIIENNGTNYSAWSTYRFNKIQIFHEILSNMNTPKNYSAFIENNKVIILNDKKLRLDINFGIGVVQNYLKLNTLNNFWSDCSIGYRFSYTLKKWSIKSTVDNNGDNFPSIYQGYRMQAHDARWTATKHFSIGLQYQSSFIQRTFFKDSIYYRSKLLSNMQQGGLVTGIGIGKLMFNIGAGILSNAVQENYKNPVYTYGSLGIGFPLFKNFTVSANNITGYQSNYGPNNRTISLHTTNVSIISKWGGLQYIEDHVPLFGYVNNVQDFTGYENIKTYGPFINKDFKKLHLQLRLQYNISINATDNSRLENGTVSANYKNNKTGLCIGFTGFKAINSINNNEVGMLSISKPILMPKPNTRRFYDLKFIFYNDQNNNGIKEPNEPLLSKATVYINEQPFITSHLGVIAIKNTPPGNYLLDFHEYHTNEGIVPAAGFLQNFDIKNSNVFFVPFKKGKVLKGNVKMVLDSLSHSKFDAGNLKIIITDSAGEKFSTLTDWKGDFEMDLPAGKYTVSLNPAAFDEIFKPVQMAYPVDLSTDNESFIKFKIRQKERKMIIIKNADIK